MIPLNRLAIDQKTVAERAWTAPKKAPKPQEPCDHGLFSDDRLQLDIADMLQDPATGK